jgi:hypothetical protein
LNLLQQAKNEMQEQRNKQEDEHIQDDATRHEAAVPAYVLEDHQLEMPTDTLAALLLLRAQFPVTQVSIWKHDKRKTT